MSLYAQASGVETEAGLSENSSLVTLPCPFDKNCPGNEKGYPDMSKVNEHLKRCHTREHRCLGCMYRYNAVPDDRLRQAKAQHRCGDSRPRARQYLLMTEEQDMAYKNVTKKTWEAVTSALSGNVTTESGEEGSPQAESSVRLDDGARIIVVTNPGSESTQTTYSVDLSEPPSLTYPSNYRATVPPTWNTSMFPERWGSGMPTDFHDMGSQLSTTPDEGDGDESFGFENYGPAVASSDLRYDSNDDQPWTVLTYHNKNPASGFGREE